MGNCTKRILPEEEDQRRIHGCCSRYWYKDWERLSELLERWERYEEMLSTMGGWRNSYCKTDPDATFMQMKTEEKGGQFVSTAWCRCEGCSGCPCRAKDQDKPKEIVLQKTFWEKREQAARNITTQRGIYLRLCRSIQVEGTFGLLKNDFGLRRFLTWGKANIRT